MNIGSLVATLGIDSRGLAKATADMKRWERESKRSIDAVNAKLKQTGDNMKQVGRSLNRNLTLPLAIAGTASFKMAKDFEFSMTKITSLVGVASDQVDQWGKEIITLAPQLGKAPKELADALFFVTSAGIRGAEAMDVLTASAKASAAGLGETKVVADLVTSAMNAYGKEVLTAEMATDILVNSVREGKAEADALASSMGMVLPISSALGVSFDQVGGAVAAMTRTGTKAQTAAIQLRQILASMLKPLGLSKEALEEMGISASDLRKSLREDGLIAVLTRLKDLQKEFGEETISKVFPNMRALAGVLDIVGENAADNVKIFESLADSAGLMESAFKTASETIEFQWQQTLAQAKTTLTELGQSVTEVILPVLKGLAERLQSVSEWFRNLSDSQKTMVVKIAGLVAALGPLLTILGFLVGNVLPGLITVGYQAVRMFKALRLVILANPYTAIAVAIGLVIAKLTLFKDEAQEATEAQKNLTDAIKRGDAAIMNTRSIEERIGILSELNKRQVQELQSAIQSQITAEEDYAAKVAQKTQDRIKSTLNETQVRNLLARRLTEGYRLTAEELLEIDRFQAEKSVQMAKESNQERLQALEEYLRQVKLRLENFQSSSGSDVGVQAKYHMQEISPIAPSPVSFTPPDHFEEIIALNKALGNLNEQYKVYGDRLSYLTGLEMAYKNTINELLDDGLSPYDEKIRELADSLKEVQIASEEARNEMTMMKQEYLDLSRAAEDFIVNITSATAQGLAKMLQGQGDWETFFSSIYSALGNFLMQIGEAIIAYGVAAEAFKEAFENPWVAIVAGAALVVLGALVTDMAAQGLATGGTVTDSGQFLVGERGPELVTLPQGSSVTSNRDLLSMKSGAGQPKQVELKIKGRDLYALIDLEQMVNNSY